VEQVQTINVSIWLLRKIELAFDILNSKAKKGSFCKFGGMFFLRHFGPTRGKPLRIKQTTLSNHLYKGELWENLSFRKKSASWRKLKRLNLTFVHCMRELALVGETH